MSRESRTTTPQTHVGPAGWLRAVAKLPATAARSVIRIHPERRTAAMSQGAGFHANSSP